MTASCSDPAEAAVVSADDMNMSTKTYEMVALDLDGTLLASNHRLDDEQAKYLRSLREEKNFLVTFATGRGASSVYEHVRKLNIPELPVVCSNGARGLICRADGSIKEELFYDPVPEEIVRRTVALSHKLGYAVQYYYEDDTYANQTTDRHYELTTLYSNLTGSIITHVEDDFEPLLRAQKLPSKLLVLFDESHHQEAQVEFKKEFGSDASIVCGLFDWFVEVLSPNVNKGEGLKKMVKHLQVPIERCIAFGDGANDLEFLQVAGRGIAMKNARDHVKSAADEVIALTNDENGVSKTLQLMEKRGQLIDRSS